MELFEIEVDGKIYTIGSSKFTAEEVEELKRLLKRMTEGMKTIDAAYETVKLLTGIPQEKLNKLDAREIMMIYALIEREAEERLRLSSH